MLSFLWKPRDDVSYDFIMIAYMIFSVISLVLVVCDRVLSVEALSGSWIVTAPFIPCLIWSIYMRNVKKLTERAKKTS